MTLEKEYCVLTMSSAEKMFELLDKIMPDLILMDVEMPDMNGLEALVKLKASKHTENIPVMILTGWTDEDFEVRGFKLGAVDFVSKPFSAPALLNRVATHLNINGLIKQRTQRVEQLQSAIITVVSDMVESRDRLTGGHVDRTAKYVRLLIESMIAGGVYADELSGWDIDTAVASARLHDVGKIMITDLILNKPGKLTPEEFKEIMRHAEEGEKIIDRMIDKTGDDRFLSHAKFFAGCHHEYWDGHGYPRGLSGCGIPLQGRIMAVADVYDALVSERSYKPSMPCEFAEEMIRNGSGVFFDPNIVNVFLSVKDAFRQIAEEPKAEQK